MAKFRIFGAVIAVAMSAVTITAPAQAQMPLQQIGVNGFGQPICSGPLGPGPCADIVAWMQRGGMQQMPQQMPQQQMPQQGFPNGMQVGPAGVPTGIIPRDGQIVGMIAQQCGGNPVCIAGAWGTVEVQRCSAGVGVQGGCFGPNGEIMKVVNRFVPQHLQPNVILNNAWKDVTEGPGDNNDIVGKNGWLRSRLGF